MEDIEITQSPELIESTEKVTRAVLRLSETLNGKAEYYIGGGLAVFAIDGSVLDRKFSDIDIVVPEDGVEAVKTTLQDGGYKFWDERFAHNGREDLVGIGGHHEYGAMDEENDTRIGIYTFDTLDDGRIIFRQHYGENDSNGAVVDKIREMIIPANISKEELFYIEPVSFKDGAVFTVTPEQIYLRKKGGKREKDISDLQKIESKIDPKKTAKLEMALSEIEIRVV